MSIYTHNYQFINKNVPQYNCFINIKLIKQRKTEKQVAMHVTT